jgi:prephenate dehydrogenase
MTVKIAIIGLGQIGASIGLALANHKDQVTTIGFDSSPEVSRKALKMEAVEKVGYNLSACIIGTDMVILALPLDQVQETLKYIAQDVCEDGMVIDTAPAKQAVAAWAKEFLPAGCHYIGLTPALNPLVLDETGFGVDAARSDLFQNGLIAVTAPHGTAGEAYKMATSFVSLLGAHAYFADLAEVDGIMATIHTLPALAAAALTDTVIGQPGWLDIRKLAGRMFVSTTQLLESEEAGALAETAHQNRTNTVRVLDEYIAKLKALRDKIEGEETNTLHSHLDRILKGRAQWRQARASGDWQGNESPRPEIPTLRDFWKQQVGLGRRAGFGLRKKDEE